MEFFPMTAPPFRPTVRSPWHRGAGDGHVEMQLPQSRCFLGSLCESCEHASTLSLHGDIRAWGKSVERCRSTPCAKPTPCKANSVDCKWWLQGSLLSVKYGSASKPTPWEAKDWPDAVTLHVESGGAEPGFQHGCPWYWWPLSRFLGWGA